jgi:hypothetical protein
MLLEEAERASELIVNKFAAAPFDEGVRCSTARGVRRGIVPFITTCASRMSSVALESVVSPQPRINIDIAVIRFPINNLMISIHCTPSRT